MKHNRIQILPSRLRLRKILNSSGVQGMSWFSEIPSVVLRRTSALCAIVAFVAVSSRAQSGREAPRAEGQNTVRIEVVESSDDLHESLQQKPALYFGAVHSPSLTFIVDDTSYDDLPAGETDPELKTFTIDRDRAYIIPILRETLAVNPNLKIIASPWSPPGWMKTSGSMIQGSLLPSAYAPLANYFVKFVQSYEAAGIPIYAVTIQNEPLNIPNNYPGLGMTAVEQTVFLRDHLGPQFHDAGIKSKILIFDHNWDLIDFPIKVLSDPKAASAADGIAIHCYGGSVTAQTELHNRFPDKDIWLTECSGGDWQKGKLLEDQTRLIIGATRNWAKSVVLWNLALNQNHEPYLGGCTTCRGVITVNDAASPAQVIETVDFTALGHASKFVQPGAYRVESNSFGQGSVEDVAFQNPDGSIVLLVLNGSGSIAPFNISWRGAYASAILKPGVVATFRWSPSR